MSATISQFRHGATIAIEDVRLQSALDTATGKFRFTREAALADLPDADGLRDHFKAIRSATLGQLATHLAQFEAQATAAGAHVHWASDGSEARAIVLDIARRHQAKLVTKSKSMVSEEIHLNTALEEAGIRPIETDLGEYLIQLAGEPPSHIIAPAIHQTKEKAAALLSAVAGRTLSSDSVDLLAAEARQQLRQQFIQADIGISGGNMLVAETGSLVLVENEGNIRLTTSAPRVHVAIVGLEKVARTWDDAAVWLSLLARSATGQPMSIYTSVITGPRRADEPDGPDAVHIILLDNGRSQLVGTEYEEALQCIRCGACLNACPVYREAGGHAYGSPYSGPIGAVISPLLFGRKTYEALPHASSLCGACKDVCPARIDLPRMLLALRRDQVSDAQLPWLQIQAEAAAATVLGSARLMQWVTGVGRIGQQPLAKNGQLRLPTALNPVADRQLPALAPRPFRKLWRDGEV
jgi:L-lactate dehydrogenase complex protein LldF